MNEKARTIVFNISALLLLAGAGLYLALPVAAPYLFAVGAAGITVCYRQCLPRIWIFAGADCTATTYLPGCCVYSPPP